MLALHLWDLGRVILCDGVTVSVGVDDRAVKNKRGESGTKCFHYCWMCMGCLLEGIDWEDKLQDS